MLKLVIAFLVLCLPFISGCPSMEKLHPCKCTESYGMQEEIICPGLENEQTLIDVMQAFKTTKKFYSFTIQNSNFRFLPHGIFKGINFLELKIISSTFMSLTDTDIAFEGLEESLRYLVITNSTIFNTWDWTVLQNLKYLQQLRIEVELDSISEDFQSLKSTFLKDISFANNEISHVHDTAFSSFKNMMTLSLKNNAIREMKRTMLPNPANMLWELDFSYNEIQQLPPDMFSNIPSLSILNLDSNQLLTIDEKPFSDIWSHIDSFDANNNYLRCDCRMVWITKLKKPKQVNAACDQPRNLKGKSLLDITEKDIWC